MLSIRFAVLSNARKYVTERVVKNGRNDLFSGSLIIANSIISFLYYWGQKWGQGKNQYLSGQKENLADDISTRFLLVAEAGFEPTTFGL